MKLSNKFVQHLHGWPLNKSRNCKQHKASAPDTATMSRVSNEIGGYLVTAGTVNNLGLSASNNKLANHLDEL